MGKWKMENGEIGNQGNLTFGGPKHLSLILRSATANAVTNTQFPVFEP